MNPSLLKTVVAGDIILVRYPYSDGVGNKQRPALVLSTLDAYGDALLMGITSQAHARDVLPLTAVDMASGQLPQVSWVKTSTLNAVHNSLFIKVIARVKPAVLAAVRSRMCPRLGCQ